MDGFLDSSVINEGRPADAGLEFGDNANDRTVHGSKYFVDTAIKDIHQHFSKVSGNYNSINKRDTVFFRLVLGGNVDLVREILQYLRENHLEEELAWATGVQKLTLNNNRHKINNSRTLNQILRVATFIVLWVIFAISTPVFYVLHAIICRITTKLSARISRKPQLPLVFAVLSGNADMVKLFLQFGTTLDSCDSQGNNLYHYLADKSTTDPEVFSRCHQLLKDITDHSQHALLLEMITCGENEIGISPLEMLVMRGSISDFVRLSRQKGCMGRMKMSVSYDKVKAMSDDNMNAYFTCAPKGSRSDSRDETRHTSGRKASEALSTVGYIEYDFDVTKHEQKDIYNKQSLLLHFLVSRNVDSLREEDISSMLGSKFLQKWMAKKARCMIWYFCLKHIFHLAVTFVLLAVIVREGGDMNPYPLVGDFMEQYAAVRTAATKEYMKHFNDTEDANVPQNLTKCPYKREMIAGRSIDGCEHKALVRVNQSCNLSDTDLLKFARPTDLSLPATSKLMLYTVMWSLVLYCITDFIQRTLFLARGMFGRRSVRAGLSNICVRLFPGSYVDTVINLFVCALFLYFFFIYENYLNSFNDLVKQAKPQHWQFENFLDYYSELRQLDTQYHQAAGRIMISCLILRFILAIHALRLVPKIGFFIITSKKMAIHLVQFGIVYGIITVIFAVVFHFVMRDCECPAKKMEEFQSILSSIFVVYTLSIGGDDDNVFVETNNATAKIVFTAYTLISVVILLNLIIAIMTTTADAVNQQPWKQGIVSMEKWKEILGIEAVFLTLYSPVMAIKDRMRGPNLGTKNVTIRVVYDSWSNESNN